VTANVTNYGLAAAITIMLFIFISIMVLIQVRATNIFEEAN
jgi:ABC-type sugar transport system permease subunit